MSKHTPGPWTACSSGESHVGTIDLGPSLTVSAGLEDNEGDICFINQLDIIDARDIANARLIAAAPDMLEALVKIEEETWAPIHDDERFLRMRNIARAVIAKAEGVNE